MAGTLSRIGVKDRCLDRLDTIVADESEPIESLHEAVESLRLAIGWESVWVGTVDPASLLATGHLLAPPDVLVPAVPRLLAWAADPDDPMRAATGPPAVSLATATRGSLQRSEMWSECLEEFGAGDIVRVLCADRHGAWGRISPVRGRQDRPYTTLDVELLCAAAPRLGAILRRIAAASAKGAVPEPPLGTAGVLVLDDAQQVLGATPAAAEWLERFPDRSIVAPVGQLPAAVYAALGAARSPLGGLASSRVCLRDGSWAVIDAAPVERLGAREIAVTIRRASDRETFDIVCQALGVSARERNVGWYVTLGLGTEEIAKRLFLSPHTVKVHLKTLFRKAKVTSRGQLVAVLTGRPAEGGLGA